jgi:hypothetical protein
MLPQTALLSSRTYPLPQHMFIEPLPSSRGMKVPTHLHLLPRSRKCGSLCLLPYTPSWRSAKFIGHRDNFTIRSSRPIFSGSFIPAFHLPSHTVAGIVVCQQICKWVAPSSGMWCCVVHEEFSDIPLKYQWTSVWVHSIPSMNIILFIVTTLRTSNPSSQIPEIKENIMHRNSDV